MALLSLVTSFFCLFEQMKYLVQRDLLFLCCKYGCRTVCKSNPWIKRVINHGWICTWNFLSSATFNSEFWLLMELSKRLPRHDICRGWFKFGELGGHCFCWIICRQYAGRHCWATLLCSVRRAWGSAHTCETAARSGSSLLPSSIKSGSRN